MKIWSSINFSQLLAQEAITFRKLPFKDKKKEKKKKEKNTPTY